MSLSVVVLTHNSANQIISCLNSIQSLASEIIIIDDNSVDNTLNLVKKFKAKVYSRRLDDFSSQRNFGFAKTSFDWVLFLDSDERLTPSLAREIKSVLSRKEYHAYRMKRLNYFFGRPIKNGGYWPDWQTRLFKRSTFAGYLGKIHETPNFRGNLGSLNNHLIHYSHQNLSQGLIKSAYWTKLEAEAFFQANHPPITWWRIIKVMVWEFCSRFFKKKGFLDGYVGFIESLIQAINRFFVYQQIWELQQQ